MTGNMHRLVSVLAMACLPEKERTILYPRWQGLEGGATLSDDFRIMWEPEASGSDRKQLVHRCHVDSEDSKDHGCVVRALDHAAGSVSFAEDWMKDGEGYTEDEFLENLGMFLGVLSHHIADLCTPVHVGSKLDATSLGFQSQKHLHRRLERDLERHSRNARVQLWPIRRVRISRQFFWSIAQWAYETWYVRLPEIYPNGTEEQALEMSSSVLSHAVLHTRDVWHTVLTTAGMTKRPWSTQPLV